jgi:glycosyltransferase involved in cell wall biosynthesis
MTKPLITVLITAYNYGRFVEESVNSVLAQDFPVGEMEVVVVDDGSTDDTAERVRRYGPRVQYFYQPNGGQAAALNLGFAKSRGEIVVLLDADDYFLPGKLARVAKAFEDDPGLGMFYHPFLEFDMDTGEQRVSKFPPLISGSPFDDPEKFLAYAGPGTCVSFRRKFLETLLPIPESIRMLADGYLGALIVFLAPIQAVPECLAAYRFHGKNSFHAEESEMSVETRKSRLAMWRIVVPLMFHWLEKNGFGRERRPVQFFYDRWALYLECQEIALQAPGRWQFFSYLLRYNRCYASQMSRRLRAINVINAFGALFTGYEYFHLLNKWRLGFSSAVRRVFGRADTA